MSRKRIVGGLGSLIACAPWESEFLERFRAGDPAVLHELYVRHAADVARVARRSLRARGRDSDVEDVVQEVFTRAFSPKVRCAFDGSRRYGPYVATMARNVVIDWARKQGREIVIDDPESLDGDVAAEPGPRIADAQALQTITRCVGGLPFELRVVHELRHVQGRPQRAVCATLGISRHELRTRELHILAGLRREIKSKH